MLPGLRLSAAAWSAAPPPTAGKAAALASDNAVIGVLGGIFRHGDAEGGSDLQAFENKIHAVGLVSHHSALPAKDKILLAHARLGPFDGDAVIAGERVNPVLVVLRPLA